MPFQRLVRLDRVSFARCVPSMSILCQARTPVAVLFPPFAGSLLGVARPSLVAFPPTCKSYLLLAWFWGLGFGFGMVRAWVEAGLGLGLGWL